MIKDGLKLSDEPLRHTNGRSDVFRGQVTSASNARKQMVQLSDAQRPDSVVASMVFLACVCCATACFTSCRSERPPTIQIGVVHSLSGTMAVSESPLVDAVRMAVDELNASGGVLGKSVEVVVADGQSDPDIFASEAERLIVQDQVAVLFGGWTSASRKAMLPVVETHNTLLFYPVQYEGLEDSPNIFYTGAAPNQQILPGVQWAYATLAKRFFLVGSDYVFPRAANEIIREQLAALGGEIVGEDYLLLGSSDVNSIVEQIEQAAPDVILNTINGESNLAFFKTLREAGITSEKIPTISFSIAEVELQAMPVGLATGDYLVWNYFQSVNSPRNREFVAAYKKRYGSDRVTDDPIQAAYTSVILWAKAVEKANALDTDAVREALHGMQHHAPEGTITIDPESQHLWRMARVGRIQEDGEVAIVWDSRVSLKPEPFPRFRDRAEWDELLDRFYRQWGNRWVNESRRIVVDPARMTESPRVLTT